MSNQTSTPYLEMMLKYVTDEIMPFHTPGHKQGKGTPRRFKEAIGERALRLDLDIDDISNYEEILEEAQQLAAEIYGADKTFFLVNGTTGGIQTMILATCESDDEIIVPRNLHKSILSGIILSGAIPIFLPCNMYFQHHIPSHIAIEDIEKMFRKHPKAKAVILVNPTYYGLTTNLKRIAELVHKEDRLLLVDEAWGAHLKFHPDLPISAMEAGADMAVNSAHKLLSAMTQASMLHCHKNRLNLDKVRVILDLLQTSSPSCLLRASLDCARMQMATEGEKLLTKAIELSDWARNEINHIKGLFCFGKEIIINNVYGLDPTRLVINVEKMGITGYEAEKILIEGYKIKVEMSDLYNIVLVISIGDTFDGIKYLVSVLQRFADSYDRKISELLVDRYENLGYLLHELPLQVMTPRDALFAQQETITLTSAIGMISAEVVAPFPPGIPLLLPGERISEHIVEYLTWELKAGMHLNGPEDKTLQTIKVVKR